MEFQVQGKRLTGSGARPVLEYAVRETLTFTFDFDLAPEAQYTLSGDTEPLRTGGPVLLATGTLSEPRTLRFEVDTMTRGFLDKCRNFRQKLHLEIVAGSGGAERVLLQDWIECAPRINVSGTPPDPIDAYYTAAEVDAPDIAEEETTRLTLPADPEVKNFSYTVVDGEVFYRENSVMTQVELSDTAKGRVTSMVELRQIVNELIDQQLNDYPDEDIQATQAKLNTTYDAFTAKYGLLFEQDSSYYLLCSLENLDEQGQLKSKAAMFMKRTIRPERTVTSVDTPAKRWRCPSGSTAK